MGNTKILVGDVGGTHARIAIVDTAEESFRVGRHDEIDTKAAGSFKAALQTYLDRVGAERPPAAALAVAGPVTSGRVHFTNSGWEISEQDLQQAGFASALLINDFAALAFSVTALPP